jgi:hypothetical protein
VVVVLFNFKNGPMTQSIAHVRAWARATRTMQSGGTLKDKFPEGFYDKEIHPVRKVKN